MGRENQDTSAALRLSVSPSPSPRPAPAWKQLLALLSLLLSGLLWINGLVESLQRPSVGNALAIRQLELSVLAAPALPAPLQPLMASNSPTKELREELARQIESSQKPSPAEQVLELALLSQQAGDAAKATKLLADLQGQVAPGQRPLLLALTGPAPGQPSAQGQLAEGWQLSPLQKLLVCQRLQGLIGAAGKPASGGPCPFPSPPGGDLVLHRQAFWRLLGVSAAPVMLLLVGIALLVREIWQGWRRRGATPPALVGPPQDLLDVTLLVAGGFVVCGELLVPLLLAPLLQNSLGFLAADPSMQQAVAVLGMYLGMMAVPLLILWTQLRQQGTPPAGGWLQWRWQPLASTLSRGLGHVLMVLPLVTLVGWLLEQLVGNASGSNPLLELVLTAHNPAALALFAVTAIVLAPLFEETLFRGVLLPVLGQRYGGPWAVVISALVFGVAHLSLGELPPLFVLGLGLGWLRLKSGRLGPSVVMHGLWNGLTFANLLLLAG